MSNWKSKYLIEAEINKNLKEQLSAFTTQLTKLSSENNKNLKEQLSEFTTQLTKLSVDNSELQTKLTTAEEKELWLHTQLKLRRTLEKMEDLILPENVEKEAWSITKRRDKWFSFFEGSDQEDFGFTTFVTCAKSVSSDSSALARSMNRLYGVLNARIHNYVETKEIVSAPFQEPSLNSLAHCLDVVDIA